MNKEEWIEVLNSAYEKAQKDYQAAEPRTPEEYMALLCMSIFDYLSSSIKENNKIMSEEEITVAKIKSYTDFPQSEALSKILSHESADMWYHGHGSPWESERIYDEDPAPFHSKFPQWDKPCWSLTGLLNVLPYGYSSILTKSFNGKEYYCEIDGKPLETNADNPVDACVDMIEKLHELKML